MTKDKARTPPITLARETSALATSGVKRQATGMGLWAFVCLLAVLVVLALFLSPAWAGATPARDPRSCLVVGVADGDTLTARCGVLGAYEQVKVRLAEIDAPEKAQPFGQRSKEALSALCFNVVSTLRPISIDRYGRTVARVECRCKDANQQQVRAGMAWAYTKYLTDQAIFQAELQARDDRAGLWRKPSAVPPWEWRAARRGGDALKLLPFLACAAPSGSGTSMLRPLTSWRSQPAPVRGFFATGERRDETVFFTDGKLHSKEILDLQRIYILVRMLHV